MIDGRGFLTIDEQVERLREFAADPAPRIPTGFPSVDTMTLGPAPGEVFYFIGASGSGKSLVATNIMWRNPDIPIIFFSMEMPFKLALQRLFGHTHDYSVTKLVEDTERNELPPMIGAMGEEYPKHLILDAGSLSLGDMSKYLAMYDEYFGERPRLVIIDYLELIIGEEGEHGQRVEETARKLKAWAKYEDIAVVVLHQTNQKVEPWEPPRQGSDRYGGYTQGDVMVGIWQPGKNPDLEEWDRKKYRNRIHAHVIKNRITGRESEGREIVFKKLPSLRLVDLTANDTADFYRKGQT